MRRLHMAFFPFARSLARVCLRFDVRCFFARCDATETAEAPHSAREAAGGAHESRVRPEAEASLNEPALVRRTLDGASAVALAGMNAGGACRGASGVRLAVGMDAGEGSGGAGEAWVASAGSARHAVLLAIHALGVNEAAVREARAESDAIRAEIEWAKNGCNGAIGCNAGAAVDATDNASGDSKCGAGGLDAASAERSRRALLLVTQMCGVSAVTVREARAERDALKEELDLSLTDGKPLGDEAIVAGPLDVKVLLKRAARDGAECALRHALSRGANVGVDTLVYAINGGNINCLRLLLEAGADIDKADCNGRTPLNVSALCGQLDCLRLLLEAGAATDKVDWHGRVALHWAASRGRIGCVRLLLEAGADKNKGDTIGFTPLHDAADCGCLDCLQLLLEAGADASKTDIGGWTTLHLAAELGHLDCLRLLLEVGADASARNKAGYTPLDIAEAHRNKEAAALLRQHAATEAP